MPKTLHIRRGGKVIVCQISEEEYEALTRRADSITLASEVNGEVRMVRFTGVNYLEFLATAVPLGISLHNAVRAIHEAAKLNRESEPSKKTVEEYIKKLVQ